MKLFFAFFLAIATTCAFAAPNKSSTPRKYQTADDKKLAGDNDFSENSLAADSIRAEKLSGAEIVKIAAEKKNYLATDDKKIHYGIAGSGGHKSTVAEVLERLKIHAKSPLRFRLKTNLDTHIPGIISVETFNENRSDLAERSAREYPDAYAFVLSYLESIFESSVLGVIHQGNYKNDTNMINGVYHFYTGLKYQDQIFGVKITAQLYKKDNRLLFYVNPYEIVVLPITPENKLNRTQENDANRRFFKFKDLFETFKPEDEILNNECPNKQVPPTEQKADETNNGADSKANEQ